MVKKILILLIVLVACCISQNYAQESIASINKLEGSKQWVALKDFFTKTKRFLIPPSTFLYLESNKLYIIDNTGGKEIKDEVKWELNTNEKFFYIQLDSSPQTRYRSFNVECWNDNGKSGCQIIFYAGKLYKKAANFQELHGSYDYFILCPITDK